MASLLTAPNVPRVDTATFVRGLRWLLIVVLAWTAGAKIFWPSLFKALLGGTGLIPAAFITPIAYGLPAVELLIAIALAARVMSTLACLASTYVSAVFSAVHAYTYASGSILPCGCVGVAITFKSSSFALFMLGLTGIMLISSVCLLWFGSESGSRPVTWKR